MKEIVTDLKAEQEALDEFLCSLRDDQWDLPTPAEGWTVSRCGVVSIHTGSCPVGLANPSRGMDGEGFGVAYCPY